ncbi:kelch-like protein diablo isoform X2 [Xenia sp. Carnegie-2017]|nr:kelch-like protein diablo isoform X2 [Xenia sp. Carnegie-2017]XP_046861408.1 kelch-like protein diablo isoform X2 [Xenia sp. Carnegie-2017]XP_046861409.1 kelch-like protein diablo isoform X2 [Xenia sp. Carnegie-2017]
MYASEYNKPELHDRILVFDVVPDGWENKILLAKKSIDEEKTGENSLTLTYQNNDNNVGYDEKLRNDNIKSGTGSTSGQSEGKQAVTEGSMSDSENGTNASIIREHKIFVHSSWLAVQSNYFRSLFFSGMKESKSREVHVMVSESDEKPHLMMLEAIYNLDILNDASVEDLLAVMELADKYYLTLLFRICKYVLTMRVTTLDACKQIMYVIREKHNFENVEDLLQLMEVTMSKNFTPLEKHFYTEKFTSQSKTFVQHLLYCKTLQTRHENTVFQALMHWMEVNNVDPNSLGNDVDFLRSVRFECLSVDYLYNVVRKHPVANKMPGFKDCLLSAMTYHALTTDASLKSLNDEDIAPRPRQLLPPTTSLFTWRILKSQLANTYSLSLVSDTFWLCGYKANMQLKYSYDSRRFTFQVLLTLLELTAKSSVNLTCYINTPDTDFFLETGFRYSVFTHTSPSQSTNNITINNTISNFAINIRVG